MNNTTFKRTLLHQDDATMTELLSDINQFVPPLNNLVDTFNKLKNEDQFNDKIFKAIKSDGVENIIKSYFEGVENGLTETGLLYQRLRNIVLEDAQEPAQAFRKAYNELISFNVKQPAAKSMFLDARSVTLKLSDISFNDTAKTFEVSKADKERLLEENFRTYINNQEEQDLYNVLADLKTPLTNYYKKLVELKHPSYAMQGLIPVDFLDSFFDFERGTDKVQIKSNSIKWGVSLKNIR